jgi:hypothetical protein
MTVYFEATQIRYTDGTTEKLKDTYFIVEDHETPAQVAQSMANYRWRNNKRVTDVDGNYISRITILHDLMVKKGLIEEYKCPLQYLTEKGIDFLWYNRELWDDVSYRFCRMIRPDHHVISKEEYKQMKVLRLLAEDPTTTVRKSAAKNYGF